MLETTAVNAAKNTEGAITVYVRYNPQFAEPTSGLFYSKNPMDNQSEKLQPTNLLQYGPNDKGYTDWYYTPVENEKPTWTLPYYNKNVNVQMISYVIPIKIDEVLIGVVGMDINFNLIQSLVEESSAYNTRFAFLTDNQILYTTKIMKWVCLYLI